MAEYARVKLRHCEMVMSKMWDLLSEDRFSDIDIKVDGKVFHCHRNVLSVASDYFCTMFGGAFAESSATEVTLQDIDASTFETVLRFMYTGDIVINTSNVCDLMYAAQFYGIALIKECIFRFANKSIHSSATDDILKLFNSAHETGMKELSDFLCGYIYEHFATFSNCSELVNLTWGNVQEFFTLGSESRGPVMTDTFVEGILKWIRSQVHVSADERKSYLDHFTAVIHTAESFTGAIQHILERHTNAERAPGRNAVAVLDERSPRSLRAFVSRRATGISSVFTLHETNAARSAWAYSGEFDWPSTFVRSVAIDNFLYTMIHKGNDGAMFSRDPRVFICASRSSMNPHRSLRPPPLKMSNFEFCGKKDNIFVYDKDCDVPMNDGSFTPDPNFTAEELSRGIFWYKRDIDKWFPLPRTNRYVHSCMTYDERLLYLIGGVRGIHYGFPYTTVKAYDLRARDWMLLPDPDNKFENAACCVRDEKIWVVGGEANPTAVEIFDPVAGKWDRGEDFRQKRARDSRLVNWDSLYHNRAIVSFCGSSLFNRSVLFSADSRPNRWNSIPCIRSAVTYNRLNLIQYSHIADMVAF